MKVGAGVRRGLATQYSQYAVVSVLSQVGDLLIQSFRDSRFFLADGGLEVGYGLRLRVLSIGCPRLALTKPLSFLPVHFDPVCVRW